VITDDANVPELVACAPTSALRLPISGSVSWLNTRAVEQMTAARLAERDAEGEVRAWLATIRGLSR
jgi:hypothetical protein